MSEKYSSKIKKILEKYEASLKAIDSLEMAHKPLPHKWSKKEILGHLIDSAYNNYQRFISAEKKENLIFEGYDQEDWVVKNGYQNRDKDEIIDLFFITNYHIAHLISNLDDKIIMNTTKVHNFDKICMRQVENGKPSSLAYLMEDYIFHLEHHLKQIL